MTDSGEFVATIPVEPWLNQGDIFESVPIVRGGAMSQQAMLRGPAMLVSHGCVVDKRTRGGQSKCEYLTFVPLLSLEAKAAEDVNAARELRRMGVARLATPYTVQYVGDIPKIGEAYASLVEPFTLPAVLFQPELVVADPTDPDDRRLTITFNDSRVARLSGQDQKVLHTKWAACWLGLTLSQEPPPAEETP